MERGRDLITDRLVKSLGRGGSMLTDIQFHALRSMSEGGRDSQN